MAYPPKNLKLPPNVVYLHVGFTNISIAALKNFFIIDSYFKAVPYNLTAEACLPSNLFLSGSLTASRHRIPIAIPIMPTT